MAEIVNLRMARKAQARRQAEQAAAHNRARFGRSRGDRALDAAEAERTSRIVENARRDHAVSPVADGQD